MREFGEIVVVWGLVDTDPDMVHLLQGLVVFFWCSLTLIERQKFQRVLVLQFLLREGQGVEETIWSEFSKSFTYGIWHITHTTE